MTMPASIPAGVYSSRRARRLASRCGWNRSWEDAHFRLVVGAAPDLVRTVARKLAIDGRPIAQTVELRAHAHRLGLLHGGDLGLGPPFGAHLLGGRRLHQVRLATEAPGVREHAET
jgi:hypothetical protein